MNQGLTILRAAQRVATRWKNNGGATREVAAFPSGSGFDDFAWRVSIADVESDGPFSRFDGIDRTIVLLGGDGMTLALDGAREHRLRQPFVPFEFSGETDVDGRLENGPTLDFNLMVRRNEARGKLVVLTGDGKVSIDAGVPLIFIARGEATLIAADGERVHLSTYDAARFNDPAQSWSLTLAADSVALAVHIRPA